MDIEKLKQETLRVFSMRQRELDHEGVEVKFLELRDDATLIGVMAVRIYGCDMKNDQAKWLFRYCGWGTDEEDMPAIFMMMLTGNGGKGHYDAFKWQDRTLREAHWHLITGNWDRYKTGDVLDVRVVLGEAEKAVESARWYNGN